MNDTEKKMRVEKALAYHKKGYNCAQSVACAFCDLVNVPEETVFAAAEGLGLGMGGMEGTCGAISAAALLSGFKNSTVHLDRPDSKAISYQDSRACINAFLQKNGTATCRVLKGVETGAVIRSCDGCIEDAADIVGTLLF